jgi:hypothetical protein
MIDISSIDDRIGLFVELHNRAKIQGHVHTLEVLTREDVIRYEYIDKYVDYLNGRVMKIKVPSLQNSIVPYLYDRDNGVNAAKNVVDNMLRVK